MLWASATPAAEITEASLQYQSFARPNFAPYFDRHMQDRLTLRLNTDLFSGLFFDNRVHGTTDDTQYKWVGWNFQVGVRLMPEFSVQYEHHSQHMLDAGMGAHFPVEDSVGFTWSIVPAKRRGTLF